MQNRYLYNYWSMIDILQDVSVSVGFYVRGGDFWEGDEARSRKPVFRARLHPRTWAEVLPDTEECADLDGDDLMANPPLAELFFRPSPDELDDGGRDGCLTSRRLDDAPYADPSLGTIVTTTDALAPPSSRLGIRGISSSSTSSPMARRGPNSLSGRGATILLLRRYCRDSLCVCGTRARGALSARSARQTALARPDARRETQQCVSAASRARAYRAWRRRRQRRCSSRALARLAQCDHGHRRAR